MAVEPPPLSSPIPLGWIIALSIFGLFVTIVFALMVIGGFGRRVAYRTAIGTMSVEPLRGPMVATGVPVSSAARSGETALNAANADQVVQTGNETAFTKNFSLDDGAAFSLKNMNGSITVSSWDQPKAEVKVIQSGSERGGQVFFTGDPRSLSIRTSQTNPSQEVRFEVKLPSGLSRVGLHSLNGSINVSHVGAAITIESVNGAIEVLDVSGLSSVKATNGKITGRLQETRGGTMEVANVNGGIELTLQPGFDANLEAFSVHGNVTIGDKYGIAIQREVAGQSARGQIGSGGQLLKLTTVNGNINLTNGSDGQLLKLTTVNGKIKVTKK
jgi:hypothetical protein